jgi:formiminotetrahydrofolate cyclodeaminase
MPCLPPPNRTKPATPGYIAASRLPKTTDEEKATRRQAMQDAIIYAAEVPLDLASTATKVLEFLEPVAREGTAHASSDTAIGINLAEAAVLAALSNVRANIPLIKHAESADRFTKLVADVESRATAQATRLRDILAAR